MNSLHGSLQLHATEALLECEIDHLLWRLALEGGVGPAELLELDLGGERTEHASLAHDVDDWRLP